MKKLQSSKSSRLFRDTCMIVGLAAFCLFWLSFASVAQAAGRQELSGHVPKAVAQSNLKSVERLSSTNRLNLAIGLPLRNQEALTNLFKQIYDPASPNYRHYLTPEQFADKFGPTKEDYQAVIAFAKANGLQVTTTHPNRVVLDVEGAVTDIEKALHVTMRTYQHPTEKRTFFAPETEPSLDLTVSVLHISGLDNFKLPHPKHLIIGAGAVGGKDGSKSGSAPGGAYMGNDFRAAYLPGVSLTGTGQTVGLFQFDGYYANDITAYEAKASLPNVPLQNVLLDGFSGTPGGGNSEVALDIQMAISMAPGLS